MHTIVILSDDLTQDAPAVKNLKKLFPECDVRIVSKTEKESLSKKAPFGAAKNDEIVKSFSW